MVSPELSEAWARIQQRGYHRDNVLFTEISRLQYGTE